jgi:pimeloyl-ACP methyl ester carboxylesterase
MDFVLAPGELDSLDDFVERARAFNPRRDERLLRSSPMHNLRRLPNGKLTLKYDRRPLRQRLSELPATLEELQHVVPLIRCPTLLVRAALSDLFLDADAERFAARLQDGRWVRIEEAGHNVQNDKPRALVEALRRFFLDAGV